MAIFLLGLGLVVRRQNQVIDDLRMHIVEVQAAAGKQMEEQLELARAHERTLRVAHEKVAQLNRELEVARAAAGLESARDRASENPDLVAFQQRQLRRVMQERYGDLFERLNLPPEKLERFKQLLVEQASTRSSLRPAASEAANADSPPPDGASAPAPRTPADIETEMRALLGDAEFEIYQDFGRELTRVRPEVSRFASDAADAGHPLTTVQRTAISRLIFEATDPRLNPEAEAAGAGDPDPSTGLAPVDELILTRATEVLSPAQLEVLRNFRIHEREGLAAWRRAIEAAPEAGPPETSTKP